MSLYEPEQLPFASGLPVVDAFLQRQAVPHSGSLQDLIQLPSRKAQCSSSAQVAFDGRDEHMWGEQEAKEYRSPDDGTGAAGDRRAIPA